MSYGQVEFYNHKVTEYTIALYIILFEISVGKFDKLVVADFIREFPDLH
jgi:hypothetical protein